MAEGLQGWDEFLKEFEQFITDADKTADEVVRAWLNDQRQKLVAKRYPPELPNQRYVRTGAFGRGWRADLEAYAIRNPVRYSGQVAGKEDQAPIHRNRWWIAYDEVDRDIPQLLDALGTRYTTQLTGGE